MKNKRFLMVSAMAIVLFVAWFTQLTSNVTVPQIEVQTSTVLNAAKPERGATATVVDSMNNDVPAGAKAELVPSVPPEKETRSRPNAALVSNVTSSSLAASETEQTQLSEWLPPARSDKIFDLNGNGRVESDEQERGDELLEGAQHFASRRSKDGSYPILKSAFLGEGKFFRALDSNQDGALTQKEYLAYETDSIRQLRRYDQNADGALSLAEYGHLKSRFDYLDEDQDGQLYAWEITLVRAQGKW